MFDLLAVESFTKRGGGKLAFGGLDTDDEVRKMTHAALELWARWRRAQEPVAELVCWPPMRIAIIM